MVVQLPIVVGNVDALIGLGYTHIEVYQSVDQGNKYNEITSSAAEAAVLLSSPANTTFRMGGRLLKVQVNGGAIQEVSFNTVVEYWTPTQVANRINEIIPGLASVYGGTMVKLTSPTTGRASNILVVYSDAADLGWTGGLSSVGLAARIPLVSGTRVYTFSDVAGRSTDRYKWCFSANGQNPISELSDPVFGSAAPLASPSDLSIGTAVFVGLDGVAQKTKVIVGQPDSVQGIASRFVGGGIKTFESDENGFLQMPLIRGSKVRVAIEGTLYVREFTVPDAASFDLLTVMAAAPDPFDVQVPAPLLNRRSV